MLRSIFSSNKQAFVIGIILLCSSFMESCAKGAASLSSKEGYLILANESTTNKEENLHWANYLYEHLKNRCTDEDPITLNDSEKDLSHIMIEIDPHLKCDFKIECNKSDINLIASNAKNMLWLQYQLIKAIGDEDPRIGVSDLSPAIISLTDTCGTFPFEYQEIYLPANRDPEYSAIIGNNNLDLEWGIWGHNLGKTFHGSNIPEEVYALTNGERNEEQFCFSSKETYSHLESYIIDNFGTGEEKSMRFMIAPNDNNIVCTCTDCLKAGNTTKSATPAVTQLITHLAKRFPNHSFFTTSYLTTQKIPSQKLPPNTGVIISAMELPFRPVSESNKLYDPFRHILNQWKNITDKIYIWDYINNFDDYLTPFPILKTMQCRLLFFQKNGVKGIFLNGSGDEYSTFEKMNTFILSSLFMQPNLPLDKLMDSYFKQYFPVSGNLLKDFYHTMEKQLSLSGKTLNLYGSIRDAENSYLNIPKFIDTYTKLENTLPKVKGEERKTLNELLIGITFTRLEIARMQSYELYGYADRRGNSLEIKPEIPHLLDRLSSYSSFPNLKYYNEQSYSIKEYIDEWNKYILQAEQPGNLLLGQKLSPLSKLDENYTDLTILTDGTSGLPNNYHLGWLISSQDNLEINLPIKEVQEAHIFRMTFLNDPKHKIYFPLRVEIIKNGNIYKTLSLSPSKQNENMGLVQGEINLKDAQTLSVKVIRPEGDKVQIATDEILLIP